MKDKRSRPSSKPSSSDELPGYKIVGALVIVVIIGLIAFSVLNSTSQESSKTVVDRTVNIKRGDYIIYSLEKGWYSVEIDSDDGLNIK